MESIKINALTFMDMLEQGSESITAQSGSINALNVFPVPDGDTGTNMALTMQSGVRQLRTGKALNEVGQVAAVFAKGLLMGARGNSGVILSQLFRGIAKALEHEKGLDAKTWAEALQSGTETAYKAVMKPVEGTILTVAREAARAAVKRARKTDDLVEVTEAALAAAKTALEATPKLLPLLKEAGVVDSGGSGLVAIFEGMLAALKGETPARPRTDAQGDLSAVHRPQEVMRTEEIRYGYCTEFIVRLNHPERFDLDAFRLRLSRDGDSILAVRDEELLKVHIHTEKPGEMLTLGQAHGELVKIKIENMREQHGQLVNDSRTVTGAHGSEANEDGKNAAAQDGDGGDLEIGIVAVASGKGLEALFKDAGATVVLAGGQTMNPSTEDILTAIQKTKAKQAIVLPNNGNIIMAAKQAAEVAEIPTVVVETKSIPAGLSALFSFNPEADLQENAERMTAAAQRVKSGQVTQAVRDTTVDGTAVKKGDFIGIFEKKIVTNDPERARTAEKLLNKMVDEQDELVTIIYGEAVNREEADKLAQSVRRLNEDLEVDVQDGGQPVFDYLIAVE